MQGLKNSLQFNVSEGSVSSINPIFTVVFWYRNHWREMGVKLPSSYFFPMQKKENKFILDQSLEQ